jgi:ADP-ribose pyrophosphatase
MKAYIEEKLKSEMIYEGGILNLRRDEVTVRTGTSYREIVEHRGGSAIGALDEDGCMIMVRQYRYALSDVLLEVPAGKREADESGLDVARRELKEETGYSAGRIDFLMEFAPTPGYSEEVLSIFLARDLTPGKTHFDPNESIEIYKISLSELVDMVMQGKIIDGKTIATILAVDRYVRGERK